jgi:hypothetical protein
MHPDKDHGGVQVTLYILRPEEALYRLRREGIQKIFQQRDSREQFIVSRLEDTNNSQKDVSGFLKGERDLKQLGTRLNNPGTPNIYKTRQVDRPKTTSVDSVQSWESTGSVSTLHTMKSQSSALGGQSSALAGAHSSQIPKAAEPMGGKKPDRCHLVNHFKASMKNMDLMEIMIGFKKPIAKDTSIIAQRGQPPEVPVFTKDPEWLDTLGYRFSVPVRDPLNAREHEAQQKLQEAFLMFENLQNTGKTVDMHRYLELMKHSHLVGNPSDVRDNLLSSIKLDDAVQVFKEVASAMLPRASLLQGRNVATPQFIMSRLEFTQSMHLVARRLNVPLPRIHNFPVDQASIIPASNTATRVSLTGVEANMKDFMDEQFQHSMQSVLQEQVNISQSGRPGSEAYFEAIAKRPATSCGFVRATGIRASTPDTIGRNLHRPEHPNASSVKVNPSRPGSACVVSMLVSSVENGIGKSGSPKTAVSKASIRMPAPTTSVIDKIYGMPSNYGVLTHIQHERVKRTRAVKRSLKRLRLPVGMQVAPERPTHVTQTYQVPFVLRFCAFVNCRSSVTRLLHVAALPY